MTRSVFQFNLFNKPQYSRKKVNLKKASIKNIFRSLFINKLRFVVRFISYKRNISNFRNIKTQNDLNEITQISRPGPLTQDFHTEFIKRIHS